MTDKEVRAFWCRYPSAPNFGDALTPWLIRKITGRLPVFTRPDVGLPVYLVVGSVLDFSTGDTSVWGAGVLSADTIVDPGTRFHAVRGPLSRARAIRCGASCPEVFGDPALLLPRFYRPQLQSKRALVGVIPHYFDKPKVMAHWRPPANCRVIDIQQPVERVIDDIACCDHIVSSSLHGLIAAHAYGVPGLWVEFSRTLLGDGIKFRDYLASTGNALYDPPSIDLHSFHPESLLQRVPPLSFNLDLEQLWEACPFGNRE